MKYQWVSTSGRISARLSSAPQSHSPLLSVRPDQAFCLFTACDSNPVTVSHHLLGLLFAAPDGKQQGGLRV